MRAEEIQKEAKLYSGPDDCYIHYECTGGTANCITHGDGYAALVGISTILLQLERASGFPRRRILRDIKALMKRISKNATFTETSED